jgi:trehalose-phosphatase
MITTTTADPTDLAAIVAAAPRPLLVAFDCDGVLSPIVEHADDAVLLPGLPDLLARVAGVAGVTVAVVSGRSLAGLEQFAFPTDVVLVGSHGAERAGRPMPPLGSTELSRLDRIDAAVIEAAAVAGDGAWIERKPASVVLHVRSADPERGARALELLTRRAAEIPGAREKPGAAVLELIARSADKGSAVVSLRDELGAATVVFTGDDRTDEDAFRSLRPDDVGIKVGPGPTAAAYRIADPGDVLALVTALADRL